MSAESPGSLPGPHRDRSRRGPPRPPRLDERRGPGGEGGARTYYDEILMLPGYGEQPDRCRARKPVGFCDGAGHVILSSANPCRTRYCPEHWDRWQKQAAVAVVARLAAYRHVQEGAGKRLLHVVDSPDPSRRWSAAAFWDERPDSYSVVEDAGGRGGVTIPHPYRTSEQGERLFRTAVEEGDYEEEWGRWSFLRSAADDWDRMQSLVEGGPHYHHLVPARDFDPDSVPEGRTVKNIRSLDRFHIRDMTGYRDMARTAMYLLSHAAWQPKAAGEAGERQTVTYWGAVHPNAFDPEEELTAAEWGRIRQMAKRAVTTRPSDDLAREHDEPDPADCPRDGCEGHVVPLDELKDWMARTDWFRSLDREQQRILRGVRWWLGYGDRPPPSRSERRVREWFRQMGREQESHRQVGLGRHA